MSLTASLLLKAASSDSGWFGLDLFASNLDLDRPTRLHHKKSAQLGCRYKQTAAQRKHFLSYQMDFGLFKASVCSSLKYQ